MTFVPMAWGCPYCATLVHLRLRAVARRADGCVVTVDDEGAVSVHLKQHHEEITGDDD